MRTTVLVSVARSCVRSLGCSASGAAAMADLMARRIELASDRWGRWEVLDGDQPVGFIGEHRRWLGHVYGKPVFVVAHRPDPMPQPACWANEVSSIPDALDLLGVHLAADGCQRRQANDCRAGLRSHRRGSDLPEPRRGDHFVDWVVREPRYHRCTVDGCDEQLPVWEGWVMGHDAWWIEDVRTADPDTEVPERRREVRRQAVHALVGEPPGPTCARPQRSLACLSAAQARLTAGCHRTALSGP